MGAGGLQFSFEVDSGRFEAAASERAELRSWLGSGAGSGLRGRLAYRAYALERDAEQRLGRCWEALVLRGVSRPEADVWSLAALSGPELERVRRAPLAPAARCSATGTEWTYGEPDRRANFIAARRPGRAARRSARCHGL